MLCLIRYPHHCLPRDDHDDLDLPPSTFVDKTDAQGEEARNPTREVLRGVRYTGMETLRRADNRAADAGWWGWD